MTGQGCQPSFGRNVWQHVAAESAAFS
jgi:hypothetical protein